VPISAEAIGEATMIGAHIDTILVVTGVITAGAFPLFLAPAEGIRMVVGAALSDEVSLAFIRHWGLLVFLIGALLICAAFDPPLRAPVMTVAVIEKIALGVGVFGSSLRERPRAAWTAAVNLVIALIYLLYFAGL
jgi:hypothetical protein